MGTMLIQTKELSKSFFTEEVETMAVKSATLEIEKGEFLAVMGPSGCGKTTLLNLLGLIDRPTSGDFLLEGKRINGLSENQNTRIRRGNMGFIFQNFNLVDELNVVENVELPLVFMGMKRRQRRERTMEILESLKMSHRAKHYPQKLSGGQQQRIAFARAIVNKPQLLLADEPTGNLDSRSGLGIMELLAEHNREGGTIVMVTHSQKDSSFAHRIIRMYDGEIDI